MKRFNIPMKTANKFFLFFILIILVAGGLSSDSSADGEHLWDSRINTLLKTDRADLVLCAVGDLIFTRRISHFKQPARQNLYRILKRANITYGNLEMSLNSTRDIAVYSFVRERDFAWEIAKIGFNMLGLANNHQLDFGPEGLKECMAILDNSNFTFAGGGLTLNDAVAAKYHRVKGSTLALLSFYSEEFKTLCQSAADKPSIATIRAPKVWLEPEEGFTEASLAPLQKDIKAMQDAIILARQSADIVIVALHFHWLDHSRTFPVPDTVPPNQQLIFHKAVEAGADIILGSGPHVLRGIEVYQGKLIFYSLGNFIYQYKKAKVPDIIYQRDPQQDIRQEFETIVARILIMKKRISKVQLIPVTIGSKGIYYGCPQLAVDTDGKRIIAQINKLSAPYGSEITFKDWYGVLKK